MKMKGTFMNQEQVIYEEIKKELIDNEINKKIKDYSKNKYELEKYYSVGKLLSRAGKHYGEGIIKRYSIKLTSELGKGYSTRTLRNMRQLFIVLIVKNGDSVCQIIILTLL